MDTINAQELLEKIGSNLHTVRSSKKLKLETVAKEMKVSHTVISRIENGRNPALSLITIVELCNYYRIPLQTIIQMDSNTVFNFHQSVNENASSVVQIGQENSEGYKQYIKHLEAEVEYLKGIRKN
ncbi:MAG: Helix-turn-helix domain [Bacteroidota bacterium]|jgi:transcriptional regulator with XRE-family HTH domain